MNVKSTYSQRALPNEFLMQRAPFSQGFGEQDTKAGKDKFKIVEDFFSPFRKLDTFKFLLRLPSTDFVAKMAKKTKTKSWLALNRRQSITE